MFNASRLLALVLPILCAAPAFADDKAPAPKAEKWVSLFNGKDMKGWTPKFTGSKLGVNYRETFRVEDGVLKVSYDKWDKFSGEFGHLFYKKPFANYRLRVEYRFVGEQVKDGPGWAFRNAGAMLHCPAPKTMDVKQEFPVSIEVQFLGGRETGERSTGNLCTPSTHVVMHGQLHKEHCTNSSSKTFRGDQWVTVEIEVRGSSFKHFVNGDEVMSYDGAQFDDSDAPAQKHLKKLKKGQSREIKSGYIALQAETHPLEYRKVEILQLLP